MRWPWVVPALVLVGCGRFGFDGGDAAAGGADAAPRDGALAMFSTPVAITEVDDPAQQDDDPTLTTDLLELYFDSSREPGTGFGWGDIWVATRTDAADPFGAPTLVTALASAEDDTTPDLSADGLRIYFGSERSSPGNRELHVSTRASRASPWSTPVLIAELASPADDSGAIEIDGGLGLIFSSGRNGTQDLFLSTRTAIDQPWSAPVAIPGLSDPGYGESQHWVNADGTVVYFSSSDAPGASGGDIFVATRPDAFADVRSARARGRAVHHRRRSRPVADAGSADDRVHELPHRQRRHLHRDPVITAPASRSASDAR